MCSGPQHCNLIFTLIPAARLELKPHLRTGVMILLPGQTCHIHYIVKVFSPFVRLKCEKMRNRKSNYKKL
jgi:hypothetical protein